MKTRKINELSKMCFNELDDNDLLLIYDSSEDESGNDERLLCDLSSTKSIRIGDLKGYILSCK